jgi:hypothetical protein
MEGYGYPSAQRSYGVKAIMEKQIPERAHGIVAFSPPALVTIHSTEE